MAEKYMAENVLSTFFAESSYTPFLSETNTVWAGYGYVGQQAVYAVCQIEEEDKIANIEKSCDILQLAVKTGNPIVTFYGSENTKQQDFNSLRAKAKWNAQIAKTSGVIPQISVVLGQCSTTTALAIANADFCIACEQAEMTFETQHMDKKVPPATMKNNSGLIALRALSPLHAAQLAAKLVAYLPANNLAPVPSFSFSPTTKIVEDGRYSAEQMLEILADIESALPVYNHYGKDIITAFATISGGLVALVITGGEQALPTTQGFEKARRFVSFCDAFSIPIVTVLGKLDYDEIDTQAALEALRVIAKLTATYADATTPKVAVITDPHSELTLSVFTGADLTVLLKDTSLLEEKAQVAMGIVENEVLADFVATPFTLRGVVASSLDIISSKREPKSPKKHSV